MEWHIYRHPEKKPVLTVTAPHQPGALLAAMKELGGTASEQRQLYARPAPWRVKCPCGSFLPRPKGREFIECKKCGIDFHVDDIHYPA